ncbi:hypothetical protein BX661DRAFT_125514, partial [Kickxella alabastrina]|uniref:uncharacterized protein n=1 Tax=Kickxella alabastrina TaxID=61397 RepID=UPI00221F9FF9
SNEKPTLTGSRIHARKRDAKATAKYEPEEFRTNIFQVIDPIAKDDFAKISAALDTAGNTLDYRRYGDTFFEVLVTGGIIAPGGIIKDDETKGKLPFSLFVLANSTDAVAQLEGAKVWANLIVRLTRRYKYLERIFAETAVHVIENIHRYSDADNRILAVGMGVLVSEGFLTMDPFRTLQKDHLTKDGSAMQFMTELMRVYLKGNTPAQLNKLLGKAKIRLLTEFFPLGKRDTECLVRHFEAEDMPEIIELHTATQAVLQRDFLVIDLVRAIREAERDEDDSNKVDVKLVTIAKKAMRKNNWEEHNVVVLCWDALMAAVEWPIKNDQVESLTVAQIKKYATLLEAFTTSPKSELALLKHVQMYCYSEARLTKVFGRIVFELYNADVLTDSAIIFWATKGIRAEGKEDFLKQTEALVSKLEALEGSDDDESED